MIDDETVIIIEGWTFLDKNGNLTKKKRKILKVLKVILHEPTS